MAEVKRCEHLEDAAKYIEREPFVYADLAPDYYSGKERCYICRIADREANAHLDSVKP